MSVATIAIVVAAGGAIYAVLHATILRSLPFPESSRLVRVFGQPPKTTDFNQRTPLHPLTFVRGRERLTALEPLEGFWVRQVALAGDGEPEAIVCAGASPGVFQLLGATPWIGRTFTRAEDESNSHLVVLSYGLWQRRFAGDRTVMGRTVQIDRQSYEVIGVMGPDFEPAFIASEMWIPLGVRSANMPNPNATSIQTLARLRPGVSKAQAQSEITALMRDLAVENPQLLQGWSAFVMDLRDATFGDRRPGLQMLVIAAAALTLIACSNMANLSMAQALARRGETALRCALGARRLDLMRLDAIEGLLVSSVGGLAGIGLASAALPPLLSLDPASTLVIGDVPIDWKVAGICGILAVFSGITSRLIPVMRYVRRDFAGSVADASIRTVGSRQSRRAQFVLLAVQTALVFVLLVSGGLLLSALNRTSQLNPGYDPKNVLVMRLRLSEAAYPTIAARAHFVRTLTERLRTVPGVIDAGATLNQWIAGFYYVTLVRFDDRPSIDGEPSTVQFRRADSGYFRTMRIPLLAGRVFTEQDGPDTPPVAVISHLFAERYWPGQDPIGRTVRRNSGVMTVVGVVGDVRDYDLNAPAEPTIYVSNDQNNAAVAPVALVVRTQGDPLQFGKAVRNAILSVDSEQAADRLMPLESFLQETLGPQRFRSVLLTVISMIGLLLAAVGIYGVTARSLQERIPEVGIRLALGAVPSQMSALMLMQSLAPVASGFVLGVVMAAGTVSYLARIFPGVAIDVLPIIASTLALFLAGIVAALWPAYQSSRIDPLTALRSAS
jgi:putative ABC transport system permease protein